MNGGRRLDDDDSVELCKAIEGLIGPHYDFIVLVIPKANPDPQDVSFAETIDKKGTAMLFKYFSKEDRMTITREMKK